MEIKVDPIDYGMSCFDSRFVLIYKKESVALKSRMINPRIATYWPKPMNCACIPVWPNWAANDIHLLCALFFVVMSYISLPLCFALSSWCNLWSITNNNLQTGYTPQQMLHCTLYSILYIYINCLIPFIGIHYFDRQFAANVLYLLFFTHNMLFCCFMVWESCMWAYVCVLVAIYSISMHICGTTS